MHLPSAAVLSRRILDDVPGTALQAARKSSQGRSAICQLGRAAARRAGQALGAAHLFFGCRNRKHDFLYEEELEAAVAQGAISQVCTRVWTRVRKRKRGGALGDEPADSATVGPCPCPAAFITALLALCCCAVAPHWILPPDPCPHPPLLACRSCTLRSRASSRGRSMCST